ncbi:MAG: TonB-dependent receptor plug domain-containing protein [Myxococcaceae bacterium]
MEPPTDDAPPPFRIEDTPTADQRAAQEEADRAAAAEAAAAAAVASESAPLPAPPPPAKPKSKTPPALPAETPMPSLAPFTHPADSRPLPPPAPAPEDDSSELERRLSAFQADPVVSSMKRKQKLSEVPMTVSWIPAEELEGTGQFTLCDAIQYFPGMECRHGAMRKAVVSARGLGSNFLSNRLLLLRDGRPETDPWTGIFYPDETTPLTNIKQIEVIRGPGSSLYGSNAFSGVINMIQRDPDDLVKDKSFGADLRLLGGQYNTGRLQATVAGKAGPVGALVNYYGFRSDGPQLFSSPAQNIVDTNEWTVVHQVSGKVVAGPLKLDASYTNARLGRPGGNNALAIGNCGRCHYTPNDSELVENVNLNAQVDKKVGNALRLFAEGYAFFKRREVNLENSITNEIQPSLGKRRRLGGEARALLTVGDLNLTLGGDVKFDVVNNQNILSDLTDKDTHQTIFGAFVDAELRLTSNLILGAGLRYDATLIPAQVWSTPSTQLSPRASIVYHVTPQVALRANYGRAFRAPTLAELAINQQMYASTLLGNPALAPETLDTVEGAVDFWPAEGKVRLTGKGIYTVASNFINQEFIFGSTSQYQNIGNAVVIGAEAEAAAQVPSINTSFDLAYQFLHTRSIGYDGVSAGSLDYAPSHRVHFRGRTTLGRFYADVYALFVSTRQDPSLAIDPTTGLESTAHTALPSYLVASARIGFNVVDNLSVSLYATNLFNTQYEESYGFPRPGLSIFSEIKFVY